jgi:cation diffusion facilitator family transporter
MENLMSGQESSIKAITYALLANLGIAITKTAAAVITGSGSLLAESIHSFADTINQLLLFLGLSRAKQKPTDKHPLGFGKIIYFWSFIVAILLFSMGGLFSIYEGINKLKHSEPLSNPWIALLVLGLSIILEGSSLIGCLRQIKKIRKNNSLRYWIKTSRSVELFVVLGEDTAAIAGLSLAFVFVLLTMITGNTVFDASGSIVIGIILLVISVSLIIKVKSLIIGVSANPDLQNLIDEEIKKDKNIKELFNIITFQLGPDVMLAAKIRLKDNIGINEACLIINNLEKQIKKNYPEIRWSFIEPDVKD